MTDTSDWYRPARGYSRPPFQAGNEAAVRHGAGSEKLVSERAQAVLADLSESYPWLVQADAILVDVLCRSITRLGALDDYIAAVLGGSATAYPRKNMPDTGVEAVPDRVWQQVARESRIVVETAAKLGLAPTDRAQLLKDHGMARHFGGDRIAALAEQGRAIRLAAGDSDV